MATTQFGGYQMPGTQFGGYDPAPRKYLKGSHSDRQGRGLARTRAVGGIPRPRPADPGRPAAVAAMGSIYGAGGPRDPNGLGAGAAPAAPALTDYASQYRDSLERSRAGIQQQFQSAFEDIAKREQGAQAAVNLLPGQVNDIYARSGANLAAMGAAGDAAQKGANLQSFESSATQMAPMVAASGMDLANRQADVPLLRLGTTAAFDQSRSGLNQAKLGALGDLDTEQRGYISNLAQAQEQAKIDKENQADNYLRDLTGKDWLANQDFGRQQAAAQMEARQAKAEEARSLNNFGGQDSSPSRGLFLQQYQPRTYQRIAHSGAYQREDRRVAREHDNQNDQNDIVGAIRRLQAKGRYRAAAVFAQRHNVGRSKL